LESVLDVPYYRPGVEALLPMQRKLVINFSF
jgi:hypothetical protein